VENSPLETTATERHFELPFAGCVVLCENVQARAVPAGVMTMSRHS
jgi:hypothetical protein